MQQFLQQMTPWGLTVFQTLIIIGGFIGLVVLLGVLRLFAQISGVIMQVGCFLIFLCIGGAATFFLIRNLTQR